MNSDEQRCRGSDQFHIALISIAGSNINLKKDRWRPPSAPALDGGAAGEVRSDVKIVSGTTYTPLDAGNQRAEMRGISIIINNGGIEMNEAHAIELNGAETNGVVVRTGRLNIQVNGVADTPDFCAVCTCRCTVCVCRCVPR